MTESEGKGIKPSILMITWNFPPKIGGMERLIFELYQHLQDYYEVAVVGPHGVAEEDSWLHNIHRPRSKGFLYFVVYSLACASRMIPRSEKPILLGGSLVIAPILFVLKALFGVRAFVYAHGLDVVYPNVMYQLLLRICLGRMDGVICNSNHTKNLVLRRFPRLSHVKVIPPGIDIEPFKEPRPRPHPRRYLLSVGRLTERKGLLPFIENSFKDLANRFEDLDLLIVGGEPKDAMFHKCGCRAKIEARLNELGLSHRVYFFDYVCDSLLIGLYQHCEMLVFPVLDMENDIEGFGLVALEAAAAERPTVAFSVGGVTDSVAHGITGFLVPPGDYRMMTSALSSVLERKQTFLRIREWLSQRFLWNIIIKEYVELFE